MMYVKELAPKEWTLRFWLHWPLSSLREWRHERVEWHGRPQRWVYDWKDYFFNLIAGLPIFLLGCGIFYYYAFMEESVAVGVVMAAIPFCGGAWMVLAPLRSWLGHFALHYYLTLSTILVVFRFLFFSVSLSAPKQRIGFVLIDRYEEVAVIKFADLSFTPVDRLDDITVELKFYGLTLSDCLALRSYFSGKAFYVSGEHPDEYKAYRGG